MFSVVTCHQWIREAGFDPVQGTEAPAKLAVEPDLRDYVKDKLLPCWSPEQISHTLLEEFPRNPDAREPREDIPGPLPQDAGGQRTPQVHRPQGHDLQASAQGRGSRHTRHRKEGTSSPGHTTS